MVKISVGDIFTAIDGSIYVVVGDNGENNLLVYCGHYFRFLRAPGTAHYNVNIVAKCPLLVWLYED